MDKTINISVQNKIAVADGTVYICGNSDYTLEIDFDREWDAFEHKTARFLYGNTYQDVVFSGNVCSVPIISNVTCFRVGVYAGDLSTSTPATVYAKKSILCGDGAPADPPINVYNQIMTRLNELKDNKYKDLADVGVLESVGESVNVLVEVDGEIKKTAKENVGVSSWHNLTDKPFDESPTGGSSIEWDGTREGLAYVDLGDGMTFYKISEIVPDLQPGTTLNCSCVVSIVEPGVEPTTETISERVLIDSEIVARGILNCCDICFIVTSVNSNEHPFPEKGIYAMFSSNPEDDSMYAWCSKITIPGFTGFPSVKTIDPKYIKDMYWEDPSVALLSAEFSNDGGMFWNTTIYDEFVNMVDSHIGKTLELDVNGEKYNVTADVSMGIYALRIGAETVCERSIRGTSTNTTFYPESLGLDGAAESYVVTVAIPPVVHPVDPKFLPAGITRINLVKTGPREDSTRMDGYTVAQVNKLLSNGGYVVFHNYATGLFYHPCMAFDDCSNDSIAAANINYTGGENVAIHTITIADNSYHSYLVVVGA